MHKYRCAECGKIFKSEQPVSRCQDPTCRCKVLIHLEGERLKRHRNCSGNCGSGCSCGCR